MNDRDRLTNLALASCYVVSAVVIVAVYREPIAALGRDVGRWLRQPARTASVRRMGGKLWLDVNEAIDDAGNR